MQFATQLAGLRYAPGRMPHQLHLVGHNREQLQNGELATKLPKQPRPWITPNPHKAG